MKWRTSTVRTGVLSASALSVALSRVLPSKLRVGIVQVTSLRVFTVFQKSFLSCVFIECILSCVNHWYHSIPLFPVSIPVTFSSWCFLSAKECNCFYNVQLHELLMYRHTENETKRHPLMWCGMVQGAHHIQTVISCWHCMPFFPFEKKGRMTWLGVSRNGPTKSWYQPCT